MTIVVVSCDDTLRDILNYAIITLTFVIIISQRIIVLLDNLFIIGVYVVVHAVNMQQFKFAAC